jgi:hypothetical protein
LLFLFTREPEDEKEGGEQNDDDGDFTTNTLGFSLNR